MENIGDDFTSSGNDSQGLSRRSHKNTPGPNSLSNSELPEKRLIWMGAVVFFVNECITLRYNKANKNWQSLHWNKICHK